MKISVCVLKGNRSVDQLGRAVARDNFIGGGLPETPDGLGGNGHR